MAAEVVTVFGSIFKYIWLVVIVPSFLYLFKKQQGIAERVTILETNEEHNKKYVEENTKATKELTEHMIKLRIDLAKIESSKD